MGPSNLMRSAAYVKLLTCAAESVFILVDISLTRGRYNLLQMSNEKERQVEAVVVRLFGISPVRCDSLFSSRTVVNFLFKRGLPV
mgnify:CR=1 FL=1